MKYIYPAKYTYSVENVRGAVRAAVLGSVLLLGMAGLIYSPFSLARDDSSTSGQSGQSSSMSGQSSSGQGSASGGHKGHQKKQGSSASRQSETSTPSGGVLEEERTGVTGETPSGGRSETSGQKRGPSGY